MREGGKEEGRRKRKGRKGERRGEREKGGEKGRKEGKKEKREGSQLWTLPRAPLSGHCSAALHQAYQTRNIQASRTRNQQVHPPPNPLPIPWDTPSCPKITEVSPWSSITGHCCVSLHQACQTRNIQACYTKNIQSKTAHQRFAAQETSILVLPSEICYTRNIQEPDG